MSVHGPLGATSQRGAFELGARATHPRSGRLSRRAAARARLGMLGLAGVLVTGLLISLGAAHTDNLLPESVRPIPSWLAGPFGSTGLDLGWGGLIAALVVMFGCYVVTVYGADRLSGRTILMSIAALHALVLLAPPLLSTDVFSYQAYARMWASYGANPYLHGPHVIALDPLYPFIGAKWVTMPTAYGPVFTTLSYALGPLSIAASVLAYKAIAAIASLVTVAAVWNAARLRGVDPVKAVALVGLNPLLVLYGVGGGHNELLMLALLMSGIYLLLRHRERSSGAMIVIAAGVKLTAGLFLPFALAGASGLGSRARRRGLLIGAGIASATLLVLSVGLFGTGPLHLIGTLQRSQSMGDWHSLSGVLTTRLGQPTAGHIVGWCLLLVFLAVFAVMLRRVWRGELDWIDGAAWTAIALVLTAGSLLPWYVAWIVPLAALASDRRLWRAALVVTGVVQAIELLGYIPHGLSLPGL